MIIVQFLQQIRTGRPVICGNTSCCYHIHVCVVLCVSNAIELDSIATVSMIANVRVCYRNYTHHTLSRSCLPIYGIYH